MISPDRLPRHFPVGTRYVVEGVPGENGELTITSRMVVLPNGTELSLPLTPQRLAARMVRRAAARPPAERRGRKSRKQKTTRS
jgi:hypothetical protein